MEKGASILVRIFSILTEKKRKRRIFLVLTENKEKGVSYLCAHIFSFDRKIEKRQYCHPYNLKVKKISIQNMTNHDIIIHQPEVM
jgi:hypothetical protein